MYISLLVDQLVQLD